MRPVSSGSSLKHSNTRPPAGLRCRLTVGASSTSTPFARASKASSRPRRSIRGSSQVAASAVGDGTLADGVALVPEPAAHAGGAVGRHDRPQPYGGLVVERPEVGTGQEAHLLLQAQPREKILHDASVWGAHAGDAVRRLRDVRGLAHVGRPGGRALRAARGHRRRLARRVPAAAGDRAQRAAPVGEPRRAAPDRARHRARAARPAAAGARAGRARQGLAPARPVAGRRRGPHEAEGELHHRPVLERAHRPVGELGALRQAAVGRDPRCRDRARLQARPARLPRQRARARPRDGRRVHGRRPPRRPRGRGRRGPQDRVRPPPRRARRPGSSRPTSKPGTSWSCHEARAQAPDRRLADHGRVPVLRRQPAVEVEPRLGPDQPRHVRLDPGRDPVVRVRRDRRRRPPGRDARRALRHVDPDLLDRRHRGHADQHGDARAAGRRPSAGTRCSRS